MRIDGKESGGKHYIPEESDGLKGIKAAEAYRKISRENDTEIIARHSGFSVEDVVTIKRHIFYEKHRKYDGYSMLSPDYDMAVAWSRIKAGHPEERDILLLHHELLESQVEKKLNCSLADAHAIAKQTYDWEAALRESVGKDGEPYGLL